MQPTRVARIKSVMMQELSAMIRELKDPRICPVTITNIDLTSDASQAIVFVLPFGRSVVEEATEEEKRGFNDCLDGLNSASGFIRKNLSQALKLKVIPTVRFKEDRGLENTFKITEILGNLKKD